MSYTSNRLKAQWIGGGRKLPGRLGGSRAVERRGRLQVCLAVFFTMRAAAWALQMRSSCALALN